MENEPAWSVGLTGSRCARLTLQRDKGVKVSKFIDNLESFFGTAFEPHHLIRLPEVFKAKPELSMMLEPLFGGIELPDKPRNEIRPALFRPPVVWMTGFDNDPVPHDKIKRCLLYSDAVAVDTMPILGRSRIALTVVGFRDEHSEQFAVETANKIQQFSALAPLIRAKIALPFSGDRPGNRPQFEGKTDPLFATVAQAETYRSQLLTEFGSVTRADVQRPFYGSFVFNVPTVDPQKVTWADIVALRRDEEIFREWRHLIHSALNILYEHKSDFNDLDAEFRETIQSEMRKWNEKLHVQRMRRTAFGELLEGTRQVALGWIGGSLAFGGLAAATGDATLTIQAGIAGGVANAGPALLSAMGKIEQAIARRPARLALEHHILAITDE